MSNMESTQIIETLQREMRKVSSMAMYNNLMWWATGQHEFYQKEVDRAFSTLDAIVLDDYKDEFIIRLLEGKKFYRARTIDVQDNSLKKCGLHYNEQRFFGFNWDESKEPPAEFAHEGRMSCEGEVALYLADDEITACTEVRPKIRQLVSVAKFRLSQDIHILDFSKRKYSIPLNTNDSKYDADVRYLLSKVLFLFTKPIYDSKDYIVTQKIAKHYREKGIKGFAYKSFYSNGINYTFFDEYMELFDWVDSRILLNYASSNQFLSLDTEEYRKDIDNSYMIENKPDKQCIGEIIRQTREIFDFDDCNTNG